MPSDVGNEDALVLEVEAALEGASYVNGCKISDSKMSADGEFTCTIEIPYPLAYHVLKLEV